MKATNDPKGKPNVITEKLPSKGFLAVKLMSSLPKFYICHNYFGGGITVLQYLSICLTNHYGYNIFVVITICFAFMNHQRVCTKNNMTGVTSETGTAYPSGASVLIPVSKRIGLQFRKSIKAFSKWQGSCQHKIIKIQRQNKRYWTEIIVWTNKERRQRDT